MNNGQGAAVLDHMLEPVSRCLTGDAARALLALRVDANQGAGLNVGFVFSAFL